MQVSAGSSGSRPANNKQALTATLVVKGVMTDPEEFGNIVLHSKFNGSAVYLRDVARIELGQ